MTHVSQRPFIPSHGDWLAANLDLNLIGLIVVNLRDGKFYCVDGQHRIYALKQNGFTKADDFIEMEVYENLSDEEMARLFLGRDKRKAIAAFTKFEIACVAGQVRENAIRRVVEANGAKIDRRREDRCIGAVASLIKIYETSTGKDTAVGWVVRILVKGFQGDPAALDGGILEALGAIGTRYNGKAKEPLLIEALGKQQSVRTVLRRAEAMREKSGYEKRQCIAAVVVDEFNKVAPKRERLIPWFKWEQPAPAPANPPARSRRVDAPVSDAVHA